MLASMCLYVLLSGLCPAIIVCVSVCVVCVCECACVCASVGLHVAA